MNNTTSIRLELGIDAQKFIQHVELNNQIIEEQISKGIQLALDDITNSDNFIQTIRFNTKEELENIVNKAIMSYNVKNKISQMIEERIGKKVEEYADKIAESITSNLK